MITFSAAAIAVLLAVAPTAINAWELPEDAYTQFPDEHLPRDAEGNVERELWKYWTHPKSMTECFDYDKCKDCWMDECVDEADTVYKVCSSWDKMKTEWMMKKGGACTSKLDPSHYGEESMCKSYGECLYKDCGYDCDFCRGPKCDGDYYDSDDESSSSSRSSTSSSSSSSSSSSVLRLQSEASQV